MSNRIFLDYASTTPLDKRVLKAMMSYFSDISGNPSAIYKEGLAAKAAVVEARTTIASLLNINKEEVIFTATGTEADNLAVLGVFNYWKTLLKNKDTNNSEKPHIITTNIEHPGILEICKHIETIGGEVTYISVEANGIVDPQKIKVALKPTTVLVSVMLANNEIGTIQPIREISRILNEFRKTTQLSIPYLHTDASQAANYMDLSFQKLGVDMMTLDASKIYGPKGVGLLAAKRHVMLSPIIFGGGQEKKLRAGTENVPGIVGIAQALKIAQEMRASESERLTEMRQYFIDQVIKHIPAVIINGDLEKRVPNNVNICIPGLDAEFAVIKLDHEGISCSSASSCMNLSEESYSYVVDALDQARAKGLANHEKSCKSSSLRFSFGRLTTRKELDLTLKKILSILITQ